MNPRREGVRWRRLGDQFWHISRGLLGEKEEDSRGEKLGEEGFAALSTPNSF